MQNDPSTDSLLDFTPIFLKHSRKLKKRNPNFDEDIAPLFEMLEAGEKVGDEVSGIGEEYEVYKVRVKNSALRKGKRAGYRVIYYLRTESHIVLLIIYAKTERDNVTSSAIIRLIKQYEIERDSDDEE